MLLRIIEDVPLAPPVRLLTELLRLSLYRTGSLIGFFTSFIDILWFLRGWKPLKKRGVVVCLGIGNACPFLGDSMPLGVSPDTSLSLGECSIALVGVGTGAGKCLRMTALGWWWEGDSMVLRLSLGLLFSGLLLLLLRMKR